MTRQVQKWTQPISAFWKQDGTQWPERSERGDLRVLIGSSIHLVAHYWLSSICKNSNCTHRVYAFSINQAATKGFKGIRLKEFLLSEHLHVSNMEPWSSILPAPQKPLHTPALINALKTTSVLTFSMVAEIPACTAQCCFLHFNKIHRHAIDVFTDTRQTNKSWAKMEESAKISETLSVVQFSSVAQSCPILFVTPWTAKSIKLKGQSEEKKLWRKVSFLRECLYCVGKSNTEG